MSSTPDSQNGLSADKQTLVALRKLRARVDQLERGRTEPIAVIGMGCRFPGGANSPDAYWQLLRDGVDAISEVPADRWDIEAFYDPDPDAPGKMYTRSGGFIDRPDLFDPHFFGISPREATSIDPQHRLILEVSWEALEHAAQNPDRLQGQAVGVFVGISTGDYGTLHMQRADPSLVDTYFGIGNAPNAAAGRVSYTLGLQGPSMAVDTACSSSLVAVHLACQSLRSGDCRMALAGGVNAILTPEISINFSRARMMAADGRCKTFDAAADGYVRGEGCGVVVLKRLSDALADHDRILAVVRGSAVNQDGRSSGFTAPNELAQEAVIRQALRSAGLNAADVQYLEAHGTGTSLGDPIEVQAAAAALGEGRAADQSLKLGSAKTNIGHLEAAAGIAGLIKLVLSLQNEAIPPHLHFKTPNPYIPWAALPVDVVTALTAWRRGSQPRIGGVSSFGFSGTNAHVLVGDPPAGEPRPPGIERPRQLLALSAKSAPALHDLAARYAVRLAGADRSSLAAICHTANTGRAHFACRMTAAGQSVDEVREALERFSRGDGAVNAVEATGGALQNGVVFLFTGQGAQYPGMARRLFESQPSFRATLEMCDAALQDHLEQPLLSVLYPRDGERSPISQTAYTQPALFAVEYALAQLWRSWGVEPAAVLGHSIGEYVAACVAGVLGLEDALAAVAARGRLMQALPAGGAMAAVFADAGRVRSALHGLEDRVVIAAINAPENTVLSGAVEALTVALDRLKGRGIESQRLDVSHAFHSPLMDPMLDAFERDMSALAFRPPTLPIVSNLTGAVVPAGLALDAVYWRRHAREAVRFADGIRTLVARGHRAFLELGPTPTLVSFGRMARAADNTIWAASLRKGRDDWEQMLTALGELYVNGCPVDWAAFDRDLVCDKVTLPTYPFQRERYWLDLSKSARRAAAAAEPIYQIVWRARDASAGLDSTTDHGEWVIFRDRGGVGARLAERLRVAGARVLCVDEADGPAVIGSDGAVTIDSGRPDQFATVWRTIDGGRHDGALHVVYLWALDALEADSGAGFQAAVAAGCSALLHLFQSLAATQHAARAQVALVTRGAQPVASDQPVRLAQAPILALLRTVMREFPELACTTVDLDPAIDEGEIDALAGELQRPATRDRVARRAGRRYVARLAPLGVALPPAMSIRSDASYLVTGGLGALGLRVAKWLVDCGARHVTLVGRREPSESARAAVRDLEAAGASIVLSRADVAREADVVRLIDEIERGRPPLRGVIHAAGVRDDGIVGQQTRARMEPVLAPKVAGTWHLHARTRDMPLDFFVLFSSSATVFGSAGQVSYGAANAFLDALAHERRRQGLPATSIAWGPWGEGGMAAQVSDIDRQRWAQVGLNLIQPVQGLDWLGRLAATPFDHVVVVPMDWTRFVPQAGDELQALLEELAPLEPRAAEPARSTAIEKDVRAELERTPSGRRRAVLEAYVRDHVRQVLALGPSARLGGQDGFRDLGMDSLMAVDLRNRLQRALGRALPATVAFDHPTVDALVGFIGRDVFAALAAEWAAPPAPAARATDVGEPIAIVGIGCRFPGGASSPRSFWRLLRDGVDAITEVPPERWDVNAFYDPDPDAPGKMSTRWGGFVEGIDQFDPHFFGMTPREALSLDPQQRLLLEVSWEALEHAGQRPDALRGSATGVFVGISGNEYVGLQLRGRPLSDLDAYAGTGNAPSMAAGRLSFTLGLQGPSLAVDTACSSSLVAVHLACQSLRQGECRLALAAGVNLILSPTTNVVLSRSRMMAADGRCKTFDAAADGYVRGEGCGVVVLKRLSDAAADGDEVLALVLGTALNQDGRSSGLTVPNGLAQEALLRDALAHAGVSPNDVSYVEAHGTGTSLGDPIEMRALGAVLCTERRPDDPLRVGSVKTNLGHLEAAAGVAGLIKTVLALQHDEIPPHLHFSSPNPLIPWPDLPVEVPISAVAWRRGDGRRIAGVSSFGFSGTNAHVVLGEAPETIVPEQARPVERPGHVLALSGKTDAGLRAVVARFVDHLASEQATSPSDLAFTANTGRAHFESRVTAIGQTAADLRHELVIWLDQARAGDRTESGELPEVVFAFSGELTDPIGRSRELYETQPTFRRAIERCAAIVDGPIGRSFVHMLYPPDGSTPALDEGNRQGLALFAVEYALVEVWQSWGLRPSTVIGHGIGDYVAGCVAGVFGLDAALGLALVHSQPEALRAAAEAISYRRAEIKMLSTQSAGSVAEAAVTTEYWAGVRPVAAPSAFSTAPAASVVIEIGWAAASWDVLLASVAALYVRGASVDWAGFDRDYPRRKIEAPTYPFQRERYWIDAPDDPAREPTTVAGLPARRDEWLYETVWDPQPYSGAGVGPGTGSWLILADAGGIAEQLAAALDSQGAACMLVRPDEDWARIETCINSSPALRGIVHLWSADVHSGERGDGVVEDARLRSVRLIRLVQALAARADGRSSPRLWLVTRGAQRVADEDSPVDLAHAPIWGLGRTIAAEHASFWGGLIDLDPAGDAGTAAASLAREILAGSDEDQIALRGGERMVARLVSSSHLAARTRDFVWRPDAAYLITGGFGGIGLEIARRMAEQGARRLILVSRNTVPGRAQWSEVPAGSATAARIAAIQELEALGATVEPVAVDVGDESALGAFLETYRRERRPPIRGVVHAAGVTQYRSLVDHGDGELEAVWRGKVNGAWLLHRLFSDCQLDCFVLFSSAASVLNSPMLGSYAAANAFLDALADLRHSQQLPVLSVNWGNWSGVGMAAGNEARQMDAGQQLIAPDEGVEMLSALLATSTPRAAVLPMNWRAWRERYPAFAAAPLLRRVVDRPAGPSGRPDGAHTVSMRSALLASSAPERRTMLVEIVTDAVAGVVRLQASALDPAAPLWNLGMDSLMALEIRNQLLERTGVTLPLVTLVEGPSIAGLASVLLDALVHLSPTDLESAEPGIDAPASLASVDTLSDEGVDALLKQLFAER